MKEDKCWICGRTSKEVWDQGKSTSVNWSKGENDCIDQFDTGFGEDKENTIPICCVCDILIKTCIQQMQECDEKYPDSGTYVVRSYLKEEIKNMLS